MVRAIYIELEIFGKKITEFENVLSLEVYNNSPFCVAVVNKYRIQPFEKTAIVVPDGSVCDFKLDLSFIQIKTADLTLRTGIDLLEIDESFAPSIIKSKIEPEIRQSVVLYLKKLK